MHDHLGRPVETLIEILTKPKQHWISSSLQHPRHAVHDAADDEGGDGGAEEGEGLGSDSTEKVQFEFGP